MFWHFHAWNRLLHSSMFLCIDVLLHYHYSGFSMWRMTVVLCMYNPQESFSTYRYAVIRFRSADFLQPAAIQLHHFSFFPCTTLINSPFEFWLVNQDAHMLWSRIFTQWRFVKVSYYFNVNTKNLIKVSSTSSCEDK